ncbi:hypothetical protein AYX14_00057 [Cryptococcus neoformans]|nr:hypothetical protein AYX14_00057 [Cryptococcus neoformans var. grubii]
MMTDKWSGGKRWGWADEYIMHRPHKGVHNRTQGMGGLRWRIFDYLSDQGAILRLDLSRPSSPTEITPQTSRSVKNQLTGKFPGILRHHHPTIGNQ